MLVVVAEYKAPTMNSQEQKFFHHKMDEGYRLWDTGIAKIQHTFPRKYNLDKHPGYIGWPAVSRCIVHIDNMVFHESLR